VGDVVTEFLAYQRGLKRQGTTVKAHESRLKRLIREPDMLAARLTPAVGAAWFEAVAGGRYAPDTVLNTLKTARAFGAWATTRRRLKVNPWGAVRYEGRRRRGKAQLTIDESRRFVATCLPMAQAGDLHALEALVYLLLGARNGECRALSGRDVDDRGRLLRLAAADDVGKTVNAKRVLQVPGVLSGMLARLAKQTGPGGRLFPWESDWSLKSIKALCRLAGVPVVTPHGLRGTHASLAVEAGTTSAAVARQLGHGDTGTIAREHYISAGAADSAGITRAVGLLVTDDSDPVTRDRKPAK
jgi:integrase